MKYFIDTNICIYFLKGLYPELLKKIISSNPEDVKIASVVKAELLYGAEKSQKRDENLEKINKFLLPFEIIAFNSGAAEKYSLIRWNLEKNGTIIGPNDLILASTVIFNNGIIVTNDEREFARIPDLKTENWVNP